VLQNVAIAEDAAAARGIDALIGRGGGVLGAAIAESGDRTPDENRHVVAPAPCIGRGCGREPARGGGHGAEPATGTARCVTRVGMTTPPA
jgi:hypothetical protein